MLRKHFNRYKTLNTILICALVVMIILNVIVRL